MEEKSIKETKELLEGVKELAKLGKQVRDILGDGYQPSDLVAGFDVIKDQADKVDVYKAAYEGVKLVKDELKDLDKEEIIELVMVLVNGVSEVEKA